MTLLPNTDVAVQRLTNLADIATFERGWNALLAHCPEATPFAAPAWLLPWARAFAPDRTQAIALQSRGELVGWLPFFTWQGTLLLAGTGPSDYASALFAEAESARVALAEAAHAAAEFGCDRIDLRQLPAHSPLLRAPVPRGWRGEVRAGDPCSIVRARAAASHHSKHLAHAERKLRRRVPVDMGCAGDGEIERAADMLETLHERRWIQRGEGGVLADPLTRTFMHAALPELHAAGLLRFYRLRAGEEIIAVLCALRLRDAEYFYLTGFDPEWARHSPGALLLAAALREAVAHGARRIDFLRGDEPYKSRYDIESVPTYRRVLQRAELHAA